MQRVYTQTIDALKKVFEAVRSPSGLHLIQYQLNKRRDPQTDRAIKVAIDYMLSEGILLRQQNAADGEKWWLASRGAVYDSNERMISLVRSTEAFENFVLDKDETPEPQPEPEPEPRVEADSEKEEVAEDEPKPTNQVEAIVQPSFSIDENVLRIIKASYSNPTIGASYFAIQNLLVEVPSQVLKLRLAVMASKNAIKEVHLIGRPVASVYILYQTPTPTGYEIAAVRESKKKKVSRREPVYVQQFITQTSPPAPAPAQAEPVSVDAPTAHLMIADDMDIVWCIDSKGTLACSDAVNDEWLLTLSPAHSARLIAFVLNVHGAAVRSETSPN